MKKTLQYLLFSLLALSPLFLANTAFAQGETVDFPYDSTSQVPVLTDDNPTDISEVLNDDAITPSNSILDRLTKFFRVSWTTYNPDNTWSPALNYIKRIINMLLALVGFISLILIIFAFYLIFFAKGEDAVKKARKILTGVAIAIGILGVSWLIVSLIFNIFVTTT